MEYNEISLSLIMTEEEFIIFKNIFQNIGNKYPEILGILSTGSLFQFNNYKKFNNFPDKNKSKKNPYFIVDGKKSRNLGYNKKSDIDIWITLKNKNITEKDLINIDKDAIKIIELRNKISLDEWGNECEKSFNKYCKNIEFYDEGWIKRNNGEYWTSKEIQKEIIGMMEEKMNDFCKRFQYFFDIPIEKFLEIRAFPEFLLNIKLLYPDIEKEKRIPVPIYIKSWLTKYNTQILYSSNMSKIFPFKKKGIILGKKIGEHFKIIEMDEKEIYLRGF